MSDPFAEAVRRLEADGLDHNAAYQLISNAVTRRTPREMLPEHADTLVESRRQYRALNEKYPPTRRAS